MTLKLPQALSTSDDHSALDLLGRYYGSTLGSGDPYTGAAFDTWDSLGTRSQDTNIFTADDLVAVTFLSVRVGPRAAQVLLDERMSEFSELLQAVGPDRDLADEAGVLSADWSGWQLDKELRALPGVGATIASKLLARKRPRLRPIYDSVVTKVLGTKQHHWEPIRAALRDNDRALHKRLDCLRDKAGLPEQVSALRVLDVIAWIEGKDQGF